MVHLGVSCGEQSMFVTRASTASSCGEQSMFVTRASTASSGFQTPTVAETRTRERRAMCHWID